MASDLIRDVLAVVAAELAEEQWATRPVGRSWQWPALTRPIGTDLLMVVEVVPLPRFRGREVVSVRGGVGFTPGMNLAPVIAAPVTAAVVFSLDPDRARQTASTRTDDAHQAAREIVTHARAWYAETTRQVTDAGTFETVLNRQLRRPGALSMGSVLMLASQGHLDEAYQLLADAEAGAGDDRVRQERRRVVRQLMRWQAAGQPTPPTFEVTLARLPRLPEPPEFSWSSVRKRARQQRRARAAVKRQSAGRTAGELAAMLMTENARRGVATSPLVVLTEASRLDQRDGPLRRARATWRQFRTAASGVRGVVGQLRDTGPPPPWRARPESAAYRARTGTDHTLVVLNGTGRQLLGQHLADAPGGATMLDVWLSAADGVGTQRGVHVNAGADVLGDLDADATARLAPDIQAAADLYDEKVFQSALAFKDVDGAVHLQFVVPPS